MSTYSIDFTDPLTPGFTIPAGGYNGPGGIAASTTLRLYGQGAREYGEAVDEDLVKLLENFMGATAPLNPVNGQLWIETTLYYFDSDAQQLYQYNYSTFIWDQIAATISSSEPSGVMGMHWYDSDDDRLYMFFQPYKQQPADWYERVFLSGEGLPGGLVPRRVSKVYDGSVGQWVSMPIVNITTDTAAPANNAIGTFRFDPEAGELYFWNGSAWTALGSTSFSGDIDANNFKVINLANATNPQDAVNLQTADARYVKLAGSTMTGPLILVAAVNSAYQATTKQYVDSLFINGGGGGGSGVPPGVIVMWSPFAGSIPAGWYLCDGTFGTPDLRERFVMCESATYPPQTTGGNANSIVASHAHTMSFLSSDSGVHTHTGTTSAVSDHTHSYVDNVTTVTTYAGGGASVTTAGVTTSDTTGAAGAHSHSFTTAANSAHSHIVAGTTASAGSSPTNTNLPPFYSLAYIMRGADVVSYPTWDPSFRTNVTLSNVNLRATWGAYVSVGGVRGTTPVPIASAKYWEYAPVKGAGSLANISVGVGPATYDGSNISGPTALTVLYDSNGNINHSGLGILIGPTFGTGDIIGIGVNKNLDTVTFYKNGTLIVTVPYVSGTLYPGVYFSIITTGPDTYVDVNFATPTLPGGYTKLTQ